MARFCALNTAGCITWDSDRCRRINNNSNNNDSNDHEEDSSNDNKNHHNHSVDTSASTGSNYGHDDDNSKNNNNYQNKKSNMRPKTNAIQRFLVRPKPLFWQVPYRLHTRLHGVYN